jgi:hypothetical protein
MRAGRAPREMPRTSFLNSREYFLRKSANCAKVLQMIDLSGFRIGAHIALSGSRLPQFASSASKKTCAVAVVLALLLGECPADIIERLVVNDATYVGSGPSGQDR